MKTFFIFIGGNNNLIPDVSDFTIKDLVFSFVLNKSLTADKMTKIPLVTYHKALNFNFLPKFWIQFLSH